MFVNVSPENVTQKYLPSGPDADRDWIPNLSRRHGLSHQAWCWSPLCSILSQRICSFISSLALECIVSE